MKRRASTERTRDRTIPAATALCLVAIACTCCRLGAQQRTDVAPAAEPVCDEHDACGCAVLGRRLAEASEGQRDDPGAVALFRRGCDGGEPVACRLLAALWEQGRVVARDRSGTFERLGPEVIATYLDVCPWSTEQWCQNLWFDAQRDVPGVLEDVQQAQALYRKACDAGDLPACGGVAWILAFRYSSTPPADERAEALFRKACDGEVWSACRNLGTMIRDGRLFSAEDLASEAYRKCGERDPVACAYASEAPERQAVVLYDRACTGGDMAACGLLADRMHAGRGPNGYDQEGAAALFQRACDGGDLVSCRGLGDLLRAGVGVAQDDVRAAALYERACDGREMLSCLRLAETLRDGPDADANPERVSELYRRACEYGVYEACPTP